MDVGVIAACGGLVVSAKSRREYGREKVRTLQDDPILPGLDRADEPVNVSVSEIIMSSRQFYAASAKGGAVLFLSGALMLLSGMLLLAVRADLMAAQGWVLWFLLTLLAAFVGVMKLRAPVLLAETTPEGLRYFHPRGSWFIPWAQLGPVQQVMLQGREMAWIGVRVLDYDQILPTIPLRLAVRLLIEQRGLLIAAAGGGCPDGRCVSDYLMDATEFRSKTQLYKGVQAMFAQRMVHLRHFIQADLLIPADLVNCSVSEFCVFINRQRLNFTQENNG